MAIFANTKTTFIKKGDRSAPLFHSRHYAYALMGYQLSGGILQPEQRIDIRNKPL